MWKVIWIDLWTTNSCMAYLLWWKAEVIANAEWARTTPSVVYIKWDELLVWDLAKKKAILEPKNVIYEVKRFIWMKYDEVKEEAESMPYDVKKWKDWWVVIVVDWKEYKPEQISAFVLKKLKEDAEKFLWTKITQAVITVPAYFNDSQRNATKAAWEIAWLKVERIINEPTAASLAYWEWKNKDEKILVFDLWGWTFDVTVLEIGSEWTYQVLSTSWDTHLWWKDFDQKIINELVRDFKEKEWIDLTENAMAMQRIKDEAENAKKQLSQREQVDIQIPFIITDKDWQPKNLEYTLTRAKFEQLCKDLIDRCKKPVLQAIEDAKVDKSDINEVILVGWSTRMPWVKKLVKDVLWKEPKATVNPDEAVAEWAAIQWGIIQWEVNDILLMDVTPLSLWVEVEWWLTNVMIPRNTTIPAKKTQIYTTAMDWQTAVTIHVVQWERKFAKDNKSLWQFNLEWIPAHMKRGEPQIEVTFDIDANGILNVHAKEKTTWKEQKVTIQWATWLSEEEIEKAKKEAEKFAEEDKKKAELVEAKNKLEHFIYQMENTLSENKDKIPEDEQKKVQEMIDKMKELQSKEDVTKEEIEKWIKEIQDELQNLYQKFQAKASEKWNDDSKDNESAVEWEVIDA